MSAVATVGLFDAKTHLSEYVARAEGGKEVIIMRHSELVAKLVPLATPSTTAALAVEPPPFQQRTFDMGLLLVDPRGLNKVVAALEDEEIIAKMRRAVDEREDLR